MTASRRVLVTGSEGHVGRHLVAELEARGHVVWCLDIKPNHRDRYWCVDVRDGLDLARAMDDAAPSVVYHLAGMVSRVTCERAHQQALSANVMGTRNIADACARIDATLIHMSTSEVYGDQRGELREDGPCRPNNWYGQTKLLSEDVVRYYVGAYGLSASIIRPFMLYHEDEAALDNRSAMIRFVRAVCHGEQLEVHSGARRSWLHMSDAVRFLASLCGAERIPSVANIGSLDIRPIDELVGIIERAVGATAHRATVSLPSRMTLIKSPSLDTAAEYGLRETVRLEDGVSRVCAAYLERCQ